MIKKSAFSILNIICLIFLTGIFFSLSDKYFNVMYLSVIGTVLLLILFLLKKKNSLTLNKIDLQLISIGIILLISLLINTSVSGIKYVMYYMIGIIFYFLATNITGLNTKLFRYITFFSYMFAVITLLSAVFPSQFIKIYNLLFSSSRSLEIMLLVDRNGHSGMAGQTGLNAFFISIGLLITFSQLLNKKNSKLIIKFIIFLVALLLTSKRGFILYDSIIILGLIYFKNRKNFIKIICWLLGISFFIIIMYYILPKIIPNIFYVFERFVNQKDFTTGRSDLYIVAWQLFKNNMKLGIGINNFANYTRIATGTEIQVHNVFLQLLAELGLIFAILVLMALIKVYHYTIKATKENIEFSEFSLIIQTLFILDFFLGNSFYDIQLLYLYIASLIMFSKKGGAE